MKPRLEGAGKELRPEIILRPLQKVDINKEYISWFSDQDVTKFLDSSNINIEDAMNHLQEGIEKKSYFMYAIVDKNSNDHIGNIKIGPINWNHYVSDISIIIGNKNYWGKGVATEAIINATKIAFSSYNIRKLCAGIIDGNVGSQKAFISAGYSMEWRQMRHVMIEDGFRDRLVMTRFNEHFSAI